MFELNANGYMYAIYLWEDSFIIEGKSHLARRFILDNLDILVEELTNRDTSKDIKISSDFNDY